MKIGILTHPLKSNYGGILQNYALQCVLKSIGHDVKTINIGKKFDYINYIKESLKYPIKRLFNDKIKPPLTKKQVDSIEQNVNIFIKQHINTTEPVIWINKALIKQHYFDAIIVGSDQVWRPGYVKKIQDMFLSFIDDPKIKRIAFAASFGIDNWTYSNKQEIQCAYEAKKFDAISVREKSGIHLCEKYLHVKAEHIMDPTILLTQYDYINLINIKQREKTKERQLTVYILDLTEEKQEIINKIAEAFHLNIIHINNHADKNPTINYQERIVPPIENWIAGFFNANYVITDSFHGTIFSIIFNKPFITLSNKTRGLTRIKSLLTCLNLEKQLILDNFNPAKLNSLFSVDFSFANKTLATEKDKAIKFLKENLK